MDKSSNQVAIDFAQSVEAQLGTQNRKEKPQNNKDLQKNSGKTENGQGGKEEAQAKTEKEAGPQKAGKVTGKQTGIQKGSSAHGTPGEKTQEMKKSAIDDARYESGQRIQSKKTSAKANPRIVAEVTEAQVIECGGDIDKLLGNVPQNAFDKYVKPEPEGRSSGIEKKPESTDSKEKNHDLHEPAKRFRKIIDRNKPLGSARPNENSAAEMPKAEHTEKKPGKDAAAGPAPISEKEQEKQLFSEKDSPATIIFGRISAMGKPRLVLLKNGAEFIIDKPIYRVGISLSNDLVIDQSPEVHTVSRYHATIYTEGSLVYIRDTSSNGTFLSSSLNEDSFSRLIKGEDVILKNGQYLKFATEIFQYREF